LHIGVIKRDMNIVRLSLECDIAIDEKGMNGHTAIELAMGLGYSDVIVLLLNHSPDTSRITAQNWLQAFGKRTESSKPFIIQLEEDVLRRKEIDFHIVERFQMKEFPMQYLKRRLL
jgi:ankyrin repeat protein